MVAEKKSTNILRVRLDPELLELVKKEADKFDIDVSTFVRWCIHTGIYLDEINAYIHIRTEDEPDFIKKLKK